MKTQYLNKWLIPVLFAGVLFLDACKKDGDELEVEQEATIRPVTSQSSAYVTQLFSYNPAPGQQINKSLGNIEGAKTVLNGKSGLVTMGAFGGNIVLGFDHTVLNQANKEDIIIYNNAFLNFAEPGVVWVMQDANNNGLPDDTWYELAGSAQNQAGYTRNYAITYTRPATITSDVAWIDNKGGSGVVKHNIFNTQAYYPEWITANTYTLTGTLLPSTNINDTNLSSISSASFAFGYADNAPGNDKLDIANAIDDKGNKVSLKGIDFIKVQTGIPYNMGSLGELSTEIKGVADISIGGI